MEITTQQLLAIMPNAEKNIRSNRNWLKDGRPMTADEATALLNRYAKECGIITPLHWVHFLANVAVESGCLRNSEENLNYSAKGPLVHALLASFSSRLYVTEEYICLMVSVILMLLSSKSISAM